MGDYREKIGKSDQTYAGPDEASIAADPVVQYMSKEAIEKAIEKNKKAMEKAAAELNFKEAARLRDEMYTLQEKLKENEKSS